MVLVGPSQYILSIVSYTIASRPVNDREELVAPADLPPFRLVHDFRAPSCLCAHRGIEGNYTESAMFVDDGPNLGKYMCGCASGQCGYLGWFFAIWSGWISDRYHFLM